MAWDFEAEAYSQTNAPYSIPNPNPNCLMLAVSIEAQ